MKRHLFFLREVRQWLLSGASYSTACACVASFVFVFMAINCGPPPQSQYHVPESAIAAAEKTTNPQIDAKRREFTEIGYYPFGKDGIYQKCLQRTTAHSQQNRAC